jgi:diguanylate cyclase (GGDEF)-like protein
MTTGPDERDDRIDRVVALLSRLASGELSARGLASTNDDDIDAVMAGVNMLAEELESSRAELEERVRDRTAEFEKLNHDIRQLTELSNLLQACETIDEAYSVINHSLGVMFAGLSGAVYLYRSSRNVLEIKSAWGGRSGSAVLAPTECWALRRGQRHFVDADEPLLSCRHVQQRTGDSICLPMSAHGETSGLLHLMDDRLHPAKAQVGASRLTQAKQSLAVAVSEQTALALANLELRDKLRLQALRDPLTGLLNRRFVEEWIEREVTRTDHSGRSFGVIMADIDHFKQINDVYGHDAGDQLLRAIADAIRSSMRAGDLPCRYGGEEFLVLLSDIEMPALATRAEELRSRVAAVRVEHRGEPVPGATLSAGIALYPDHGISASLVIDAADAALYAAKRAGRDRVITAAERIPDSSA